MLCSNPIFSCIINGSSLWTELLQVLPVWNLESTWVWDHKCNVHVYLNICNLITHRYKTSPFMTYNFPEEEWPPHPGTGLLYFSFTRSHTEATGDPLARWLVTYHEMQQKIKFILFCRQTICCCLELNALHLFWWQRFLKSTKEISLRLWEEEGGIMMN